MPRRTTLSLKQHRWTVATLSIENLTVGYRQENVVNWITMRSVFMYVLVCVLRNLWRRVDWDWLLSCGRTMFSMYAVFRGSLMCPPSVPAFRRRTYPLITYTLELASYVFMLSSPDSLGKGTVFGLSVRPFIHSSRQIMSPRYLMNGRLGQSRWNLQGILTIPYW